MVSYFCHILCHCLVLFYQILTGENIKKHSKNINNKFLFSKLSTFFSENINNYNVTMIQLSLIYALGNIVLTGASIVDMINLDIQRIIALIGLVLISIGTGGIKPCGCTLGGDQFKLPEQQEQLKYFFNRYIIAIYIGATISTFITPELRNTVHCFGKDSCFPLAFGVPAILMILAIIIVVLGSKMYIKKKPEQDVILRTFTSIFYALRKKLFSTTDQKQHWIESARSKYTDVEVSDSKAALEVLLIFLSYPLFWALYEQQGSRWTLQATLMNGKIDNLNWVMKPDQLQTVVPFFALVFLLTFDYSLYPILKKLGIKKPLQRIIFSYFLASIAFIVTAILQWHIFGETTVISPNEGLVKIYNGFDCNATISSMKILNITSKSLDVTDIKYLPILDVTADDYTLSFDPSCSPLKDRKIKTNITILKGKSISYFLTRNFEENVVLLRVNKESDNFFKPKNGNPQLRILTSENIHNNETFEIVYADKDNMKTTYSLSMYLNGFFRGVNLGNYKLLHNGKSLNESLNFTPTTIYTLIVQRNDDKMNIKLLSMDNGNYLHILWQSPQYLFMITADVIFVATTIEFSFTEAPPRIKSFISACYSLTQSVGNLLVVFVSALSFKNQVHEYLLYSGLMFINTLFLIYLSLNYKYKTFSENNIKNTTEN
ncbi:peptide transporter family 1-like isoform X2 [Daktulosphaira vitifoliae]|uniref:peptide transporter family 1-like isoform X2 n=1 Tax=Daktulosphaira vitifoliae TaxID=58002 RepID=UPI0021AA5D18|nr:peptide transporter family 1-like isoform X2 [Daktulosphaira vitifoliae]